MVKRNLMFSLLLFASSSVLAQVCDPSNATGQCGFRDANGNLVRSAEEVYSSYQQQGGAPYTPPSQKIIKKPDSFASLAAAKSGRTFSVTNMHSNAEAERSALRNCEQATGEKCAVMHSFRNGCMSAASGMLKSGGYRLFPASAPTGREAERKAMAACEAAGLHDCLLIFEVPACSFFLKLVSS